MSSIPNRASRLIRSYPHTARYLGAVAVLVVAVELLW